MRKEGAGEGFVFVSVGGEEGEREEDGAEEELGDEGEGFETGGCCWSGGGEVEEGVVWGEVVAVVDAREVVEVGLVEEGVAVKGVHEGVEEGEGEEGGEGECEAGGVEKGEEAVGESRRGMGGLRARGWGFEVEDDGGRVDEGVDLEVDGETEEDACESGAAMHDCPEQGHHHDTQEAFGAASGADGCDHGVEQPDAGELQGARSRYTASLWGAEHEEDEPSGYDVC